MCGEKVSQNMDSTNDYTYSHDTTAWITGADLASRKKLGQYMTPRETADLLIEKLGTIPETAHFLDPSAGTGELLAAAARVHPHAQLTGWEIDPHVAQHARQHIPTASIITVDSLHEPANPIFDIVVGNPPFFEFSPDTATKNAYSDVIAGRANIYGLFFKVGLQALKPGGTLAYIVPPSMNTGAYFNKLRTYILQHATIESLNIIVKHDMFDQAQVIIQMIVLKKRHTPLSAQSIPENGPHHYTYDNARTGRSHYRKTFFCENPQPLQSYFTAPGSSNLADLGYTVKTGTITWNEHTKNLGNDPSAPGAKQLFWSKDIAADNTLTPSEKIRYRHVISPVWETGPAILSNRIVGTVGKPSVRFAHVPEGVEFLAENHVNVIQPTAGEQQLLPIADVHKKLCGTDFSNILKTVTGSTQLSSKELNYLLRIKH